VTIFVAYLVTLSIGLLVLDETSVASSRMIWSDLQTQSTDSGIDISEEL
jgi:hypothetical protein